MTRTNQLLLLLLVFTGAVSAYWFLALAPQREQAAALRSQVVAKQGEVDAALTQVAAYEQARAAYPENYATVARLGKAVPADDDVRSLMVQLDAAAKRSNVGFELIDVGGGSAPAGGTSSGTAPADVIPGATVSAEGFTTLPMTFAFRGSYFELSSLFTRLERFVTVSNRRIDVTGRLLILHSISLVPDEPGSPEMVAQINATSYLVPAAASVPGGADPQGATGTAAAPSGQPTPAGASAPTPATVTGAVG